MSSLDLQVAQGPRDSLEDVLCAIQLFRPSQSPLQFLGVFDGAGGLSQGHIAAEVSKQTVAAHICSGLVGLPTTVAPGPLNDASIQLLFESLIRANDAVLYAARELGHQIASTGACAIVEDGTLQVAWVGDSRVYSFDRENGLTLITHDHTRVQELIDADQISVEDAAIHPERHVLTRYLGQDVRRFAPSFRIISLHNDDTRVVVCSDGVKSALTDTELERFSDQHHCTDDFARRLVAHCLRHGVSDNVSVVTSNPRSIQQYPTRQTITSGYRAQFAKATQRLNSPHKEVVTHVG